jgi:Fur family ferric uptake transcriptional regulator
MDTQSTSESPWSAVRNEFRVRGMRWTAQRQLIVDVLAATSGHVTGGEIVERCRSRDPDATPSTVYRTLDALEELGYIHHSHGADGHEEYHVLPDRRHAHLQCEQCGRTWELEPNEVGELVQGLERSRGFEVHVAHLTIAGGCAECRAGLGDVASRDG